MKTFTFSLNSAGSMVFNKADGALIVSVLPAQGGSYTALGGIPFKGLDSQPITLANGQGTVIAASSPASPIDGWTITWVSGVVNIIVGFQ